MADKHLGSWAVCPSIPLKDRRLINGPVIFGSRVKAEAFLTDPTILVFDGWGRGEEKNFATRDEWLQEIASWFVLQSETTPDHWDDFSRAEIMAAQEKRDKMVMARFDRRPISKRAVCVPPRPGSDVYLCPWPKQFRAAQGDLIGFAKPVHHLSADSGPPCSRRLAEIHPEEVNPTAVFDLGQLLEMCKIDPVQPWMYCLDRSWDFGRIAQEASEHKWHKAIKFNLSIKSPRQHFWRIVLELEESLHEYHLKLSFTSLRAFWTSWQVANHFDGIRREIEKYAELPGAVGGQTADIGEAVTMIEQNLRFYANGLHSEMAGRHPREGSVEGDSAQGSNKPDLPRLGRLDTYASMTGWAQPAGEPEPKPRAKPGPKRNRDAARNVLAIIERVAVKNKWKSKLEEICEALDGANIPCPKTWPRRQPPMRTWTDAFSVEPDLAKKAISYHLKNAQN